MLSAKNITKRFGGVTALAGVDVDVARGEVLGLIGPNGSGKTTLLNCVSGVLQVDGGEITLDSRSLTHASRVRRAHAGIARTFQTPRLFSGMTVRENVEVGLQALASGRRSIGTDGIRALLRRLDLDDVSRLVVTSLPYGYQRRVEIARALAGQPSVLLLDEPAAGLNDTETVELRRLLHEVRSEDNCSMIVIDHDMNLIMGVSDRVQVLDEGQVIFTGDPEAVFQQRHVVAAYLGG